MNLDIHKKSPSLIGITNGNTLPASDSKVVQQIVGIVNEEISIKTQLLTPDEFKAINPALFRQTNPALSFALLYPENLSIAVRNCLTTFPEIQQTGNVYVFCDTKLELQVWKLLKLNDNQEYNERNFVRKLFPPKFLLETVFSDGTQSKENLSILITAKRILRCVEYRSCTLEFIIRKTQFSTELVKAISKKLLKHKLICQV